MATKFPGVVHIPADQMCVDPDDIAIGLQRDPMDRFNSLVDAFGDDGERFNADIFGILIVKKNPEGPLPYSIKDGGGRHLAVTHLLKQPKLPLPCIVTKGDDLDVFAGQNARTMVPDGVLFWGYGNGTNPEHKYAQKICKILRTTREGFTTRPGKVGALKVNNVKFAFDLGVLGPTISLADVYWAGPKRNRRIEGIGLTGLAAFLALYPEHDGERLARILDIVTYDDLKEAARSFLPKNKEHQRQWGVAICKELVTRYNNGIRSVPRLNLDKVATLQERLEGHDNFTIHSQVWEMRKAIPTTTSRKKPHLKVVGA